MPAYRIDTTTRSKRVDWFRVLADLQNRAGMTRADVAREVGISESTVRALYTGQNQAPLFDAGYSILMLWSQYAAKPVSEYPPLP